MDFDILDGIWNDILFEGICGEEEKVNGKVLEDFSDNMERWLLEVKMIEEDEVVDYDLIEDV